MTNKEISYLMKKLDQFMLTHETMDCFLLHVTIRENLINWEKESKKLTAGITWHSKTEEYIQAKLQAETKNQPEEGADDKVKEKLSKKLEKDMFLVNEKYSGVIEYNNKSQANLDKIMGKDNPKFRVRKISKYDVIDSTGNPIKMDWDNSCLIGDIIND